MRRDEDNYTKQEIMDKLKMTNEEFEELTPDKLELVYAKTEKQTKELGMPPESSPDNEEHYTSESVKRLEAERRIKHVLETPIETDEQLEELGKTYTD